MLDDPIGSLLEAANTFFEEDVTTYEETPLAEGPPAPDQFPAQPQPYSAQPYTGGGYPASAYPPARNEPAYPPQPQPAPPIDRPPGQPSLEDYVAAGVG
jgi:hypothetical protein